MNTIIASFDSLTDAENAMTAVRKVGVRDENIGLIVSEQARTRYFGDKAKPSKSTLNPDISTKAPEGASLGAVAGGIIGGIAAGLAAVGSIAVPGIGLLAAGPIVAALAGGGAGAAVGGLTGALVGLGFPEMDAKFYEDKLKSGHILVTVNTVNDEQSSQVTDILKKYEPDSLAA